MRTQEAEFWPTPANLRGKSINNAGIYPSPCFLSPGFVIKINQT
jgi:hypothetical protein